jgi:diacylglycerol kinase (ATP)
MKFHTVIIIFNPNSTGDGKANAKELRQRITEHSPDMKIVVRPTKHAGHAVDIAAEYAADASAVIVSSSGDGGYNEVVNGVLKSSKPKAALAVLPSGNANDHYNAVSTDDLVKNIVEGNSKLIEAIHIQAIVDGKEWNRFAHSYVGFGITPKIGKELTARKLNMFNEKWHTLYHLMKFKHVDISQDKVVKKYSSLVFSTVPKMSKIIRLEDSANQRDGKMEVYETEYQSPIQLLWVLLRASLQGIEKSARVDRYSLKTISRTMVQLDGEVFMLDADSDIQLTCVKSAIRTVL